MSARLFSRLRVFPTSLATRSSRRLASTYPTAIKPSKDEISSGRLASRNLEIAIRCLHEDGLVVIEDAIPHEDLDRLNNKMVQDARTLQSRGKDMPFNYNVGNSKLCHLHSKSRAPMYINTINTCHRSPTRPPSDLPILPSLHLPQPHRHPTNNNPPRPPPQMDLLLRQLRHAQSKPATPTSTH
jgi:hypothetical protein